MEKIFSAALFGLSLFSAAQNVEIAAKTNLLFHTGSNSWSNISSTAINAYNEKGKNTVGFNAGLSLKVGLVGFFVMPELYYTHFKNEFTTTDASNGSSTTLEAKSDRIDVPVLIGKDILMKKLGLFVGPVASFNLTGDQQISNFKEEAPKSFTVGYQFGANVNISSLIITAKYEGAFSKDMRNIINTVAGTNQTIRYDDRPNFVMLGLGYKF